MSAGGKKKNKKNKTTISLNEFLTDDKGSKPSVYMAPSSSWADEVDNDVGEEMGFGSSATPVNIAALPTAPRAARGADVDMDRVPMNPPFTAFLGNIPFDIDIESIEKFFHGFVVLNIRLPEEGGRMKGFGYVEFEKRQMLVDALALNDAMLKNRKVRIDLAGQSQDGKERGGFGGSRDNRDDGGEDRTLGDWRKSDSSSSFGQSGGSSDRYGDRGGDRYGDRGGDRYGDRGGDRYGDRGGYGDRERNDDRSDRGGSWGHDRQDDRKSFGSGYRDDRGFRRDDNYGDRPPHRDNDRYQPPRDGGDRYQPPRDGGDRYGAPRDNYGPSDFSSRDRAHEDKDSTPRERPRLNLQPRSKPKEDPISEKPKEASKTSSIFGSAKPVNTAAREREIEERLTRRKDIQRLDDRRSAPEKPRSRQDSAESEEGRGPRRERKLSSSSSGKGIRVVAPPPTSSSRTRSENSRSEEEVFDEKEPKKEKTPEPKLIAAPPPKENVWKRKTVPTEPSKENAPPPTRAAPAHNEVKSHPMSDSNRSKGHLVAAEAPRVNVWDKKKKDAPKEKKLPQSIDEMPKLEASECKDFSDSNKFAGLDEDAE